ncbi:MAG: dipeptidase [archaeon]
MKISEKTLDFHYNTPVVDLHADTLLCIKILEKLLINYNIFREHKQRIPLSPLLNHVDVPRMKKGGVNLQGFGIVTNYWSNKNKNAKETVQLLHKLVRSSPDIIWARNEKEAREAWTNGQIGVFLGMEGAHPLEGRLENIDWFYKKGVRYIGLSHFNTTEAAHSAMTGKKDMYKPLTPFGKDLIAKMNDLGMIVDLAHANYQGFMQAAQLSKQPVIVSHTGIYNCCKNERRNLFDDQIHAVAQTNGVIGIMFAPYFLRGKWQGSVSDIVDHMEYVKELVGIEYIALGSDFDGFITLPTEMKGVNDLPTITQEMFNRNWTEDDIKKVLGENFLRVYKEVCN